MHKFFTPKELINGDVAKIIGDDVKHIYKVLRLSVGDIVAINDCNGNEFLGELEDINKKKNMIQTAQRIVKGTDRHYRIYLVTALILLAVFALGCCFYLPLLFE